MKKIYDKIKKPEIILIFLIMIVGGIFIYNIVISIPTRNYSLEIDAIKDPESLLLNSRVILKNTGFLPLNNLNIIYDNNVKFTEKINTIKPGETIILSPPTGTALNNVQVKSKEGIDLNKEFRSPIKLPGMIGS
ncbi:MAG: hypothetical protein ABJB76_09355 [Candidatus Nitrosocosmicus sp.]